MKSRFDSLFSGGAASKLLEIHGQTVTLQRHPDAEAEDLSALVELQDNLLIDVEDGEGMRQTGTFSFLASALPSGSLVGAAITHESVTYRVTGIGQTIGGLTPLQAVSFEPTERIRQNARGRRGQ